MRKLFKFLTNEYFLIFVILVLGFGVRLYKLDNPIADWHSWRQADTASVSRIYLQNGVDMLRPTYQDISSIQTGIFNADGLRLVEFPIFNLLNSTLAKYIPIHYPDRILSKTWKAIGYSPSSIELWGRFISIGSSLLSGLFLYLIGKRIYGKWVGILAAWFFMFLPYSIYFSRVILPEPMAVMFGLAGLWAYVEFIHSERQLTIILAGVFFALSLLVKPFSAFYLLPALYLLVRKYGFLWFKKSNVMVPQIVFFNIALAPFFLWRIWINPNPVGIPHFSWAFNGDEIRFRPAFWRWIYGERIGNLILGVWGVIVLAFSLLTPSKSKYAHFLHVFLLGSVLYMTIFATASVRHDYYQTFVIPSIALAVGYGAYSMWQNSPFNRHATRLLLLFSVFVMLVASWVQIKEDYNVNHPEIIVAGQYVDKNTPKDAQVIAPYTGDTAFLYETNRQGWPVVDTGWDKMLERGADYFVSVNFSDPDVAMLAAKYKVVEKNSTFILIDLHQELKTK